VLMGARSAPGDRSGGKGRPASRPAPQPPGRCPLGTVRHVSVALRGHQLHARSLDVRAATSVADARVGSRPRARRLVHAADERHHGDRRPHHPPRCGGRRRGSPSAPPGV